MWFNRHRMANLSHAVGDDQWSIADRFAVGGGARRSAPAAPANRAVQAFSSRRLQPRGEASASHFDGGPPRDGTCASQTLRHAPGALRRTRPTNLRPIQVHRPKSNSCELVQFPSKSTSHVQLRCHRDILNARRCHRDISPFLELCLNGGVCVRNAIRLALANLGRLRRRVAAVGPPVASTFLSAGSRNFPVPFSKNTQSAIRGLPFPTCRANSSRQLVAPTRRAEALRRRKRSDGGPK
jgi:hypothetical protein